MPNDPINVIVAGLGGQGVLKASDILAEAAFRAGYEVKKSEIHGMSQRGGSVTSDVRFGLGEILSPMVPEGEADFLVAFSDDQARIHHRQLRPGGTVIEPGAPQERTGGSTRTLNVALLGALSARLPIDDDSWRAAIAANLPERYHAANLEAFAAGRAAKA